MSDMFIVKVGSQALGSSDLFKLTSDPANYLYCTSEEVAEQTVGRALEKYPEQSLDGYVIEAAERP